MIRLITSVSNSFQRLNTHQIRWLASNRREQGMLRRKIIKMHCNNQDGCTCHFCSKYLPLCLIEAAHIKPRYLLDCKERHDISVIMLLCLYCHNLYDKGLIWVNSEGILSISPTLQTGGYDLDNLKNVKIKIHTEKNKEFFEYHYKNIAKQ